MNNMNLSLDGEWKIIFDHDNRGKYCGWGRYENFAGWYDIEEITVPSCWEEVMLDYEGVAWYHRSFAAPADFKGKCVRLSFGAVNFRAEVWLNGEPAGVHEGGYAPFEFEIGDMLRWQGDNHLIVRVVGPIITRDIIIDGLEMNETPHWRGAIAGGIWQSVNLAASGSVYLKDIFVQPDIHGGKIAVSCKIVNTGLKSESITFKSAVKSPLNLNAPCGSFEKKLISDPGADELTFEIDMPGFKYWSPDTPHLYTLETEAHMPSGLSDSIKTRFGMREFTVKGTKFYLNGEPLLLKAAFYEGLYPHTLAYPRDTGMLREDIRLAKEAGMNMLRPWRKPQIPAFYDLADEMGMLVVGAPAIECMDFWPKITPYLEIRVTAEISEMIMRDRNHPCIVIWEMFNEIFRQPLKRLMHKTSVMSRRLDPTRLIIDESGGFSGGANFYLPRGFEPVPFNDVHYYPGAPLSNPSYNALLTVGKTPEQVDTLGIPQKDRLKGFVATPEIDKETGEAKKTGREMKFTMPGRLSNITELGYGSMPDLEDNVARYEAEGNRLTPDYRQHKKLLDTYKKVLAETGADKFYPTLRDFFLAAQEIHAEGNKDMAEAARINPDVAGICIHALTDGDWILGAGLVDLFRQPKPAYYAAMKSFARRYIAVRPQKPNFFTGDNVTLNITTVNEGQDIEGNLALSISIEAENGETVYENPKISVSSNPGAPGLPSGISGTVKISVPCGAPGKYNALVSFTAADGSISVENSAGFYILDEAEAVFPAEPFTLYDEDGALKTYLRRRGAAFSEPASGGAEPSGLIAVAGALSDTAASEGIWGAVERGATAVYLGLPPGRTLERGKGISVGKPHLPFEVNIIISRGLWSSHSHIAKPHPIFEGLPSGCIMGRPYQNVFAQRSMNGMGGDWPAGVVGFGVMWQPRYRMNYTGRTIDTAFQAADIAIVPYGKGRFILSTMRLVENLAHDPFAGRITANLLRWAEGG